MRAACAAGLNGDFGLKFEGSARHVNYTLRSETKASTASCRASTVTRLLLLLYPSHHSCHHSSRSVCQLMDCARQCLAG